MKQEVMKIVDGHVKTVLEQYTYGDIITFETLERLFGVDREESKFLVLLQSLKDELIRYGYILSSIMGEGYKILFPNEVPAEVYRKYGIQALNRLNKGTYILNCIDKTDLTQNEKDAFDSLDKCLQTLKIKAETDLLSIQGILFNKKVEELQ